MINMTIEPFDMLMSHNTRLNLQEQYIRELQFNQMELSKMVAQQANLIRDITHQNAKLTALIQNMQ